MVSKLDHALALAAKGFKVFPIRPGAKAPPLLNGWPQKATSDPEQIKQFWLPMPDANIGIHCEGLLVIDVDVAKGGDESLTLLEITDGLPPTLTARTPTGGRHLYYRTAVALPNSVGTLGRGIDTRSRGGYVVAAGSEVQAGRYAFDDDGVVPADAPQWLIDRLGAAPERVASAPAKVADAPDETLTQARTWLEGQDGAVAGTGGDAKTYAVACGLRDRGVSKQQALELLGEWNDKCDPPWSPRELKAKIHNAYAYGQNAPGARVALPADFPIVPETGPITPKLGAKLLSLSEFANQEARGHGYVVKGLLRRASYAIIYGSPGAGKTFAMLDAAYHVAAGKDWMGRKVHQGCVVYLAYEGEGGLVDRAKALRQKYGTADVPLYIVGAAFNLKEKTGRAELGDLIAQLPAKPVLIVVDTFARAIDAMGGDENSAHDAGAFNHAVAALIASTRAAVVVLHHPGKDAARGARGSSAIKGALDTEIEAEGGLLSPRKQRDMALGDALGFKLTPLVVGVDEDGDEVTSCVVEAASVSAVKGLPSIRGNNKRGFDTLCLASPDNAPVTYGTWRDACREFLGEKNVTARFSDIKRELVKRGYVTEDDKGLFSRRCS